MVDREGIPEKVRQFLWGRIDSVMQLEALLLLHADPARVWTPEEIAAELRTDPLGARQQIAPLIPRGLVRAATAEGAGPDAIQFGASTAELEAVMRQVASLYALRRVTIITLIYSRPGPAADDPPASSEMDAIRQFANAFRLRKPAPPPPPNSS